MTDIALLWISVSRSLPFAVFIFFSWRWNVTSRIYVRKNIAFFGYWSVFPHDLYLYWLQTNSVHYTYYADLHQNDFYSQLHTRLLFSLTTTYIHVQRLYLDSYNKHFTLLMLTCCFPLNFCNENIGSIKRNSMVINLKDHFRVFWLGCNNFSVFLTIIVHNGEWLLMHPNCEVKTKNNDNWPCTR